MELVSLKMEKHMPKEAHKKAAESYKQASKHHEDASKHSEAGNDKDSAHSAIQAKSHSNQGKK